MKRSLVALVLLAGCGDGWEGFSDLFASLTEPARTMNAEEIAIYDETSACMDLDPQPRITLPTIEYCVCSPAPCEPCVEDRPEVLGTYRDGLWNRISIRPDYRGVDHVLRHEAIHARLEWETGDLDPGHRSSFFGACDQ